VILGSVAAQDGDSRIERIRELLAGADAQRAAAEHDAARELVREALVACRALPESADRFELQTLRNRLAALEHMLGNLRGSPALFEKMHARVRRDAARRSAVALSHDASQPMIGPPSIG
jgi:hypothetical protein